MNERRIFSFAFDGIHRAGKGTQIEILKNNLLKSGVPCVSIRGEGYRSGTADSPDNPHSNFWLRLSEQLKKSQNLKIWDEASYRLARELLVWRDRILSQQLEKNLAPFGVLLIDRSFISKSVLKNVHETVPPNKIFSSDDLYPSLLQKNKKITPDMVLPDIIFELSAPKDVLLSRLDASDPDFDFRKRNIETSHDIYKEAKNHLSQNIKDVIVTIDSSLSPDIIHKEVVKHIIEKFPELKTALQ